MLDIQIKNISKDTFSFRKFNTEFLHIVDSNNYHIIFFNERCECEVNFKKCKVDSTQVLFLNVSDVFVCRTKTNSISKFSFDYNIFNNNHSETEQFIKGLLFDSLLSCNLLRFNLEELRKVKLELDKIISSQTKGDYKNSKIAFTEFIIQLIFKKHKQSFPKSKISKNHLAVYKYLSLVNEHFKMEHNVFIYAQILRVQPKILTKIFSDLKIENPKSYLNKRILLAVKKILAYTPNKSTQIAYEVGFNDPAYFARFFKKNTGLTPKQFRLIINSR